MGFSAYHLSMRTCKQFFSLFDNITNNSVIIVDSDGFHVKCSNKKFKIHSVLDNTLFNRFTCDQEYILSLSIKKLNSIFKKHTHDTSIRIIYSGQSNILFIINNNSTYSIPCTIVQNEMYIKRIRTIDESFIDYEVEFEIESSYIYSILRKACPRNSGKKQLHITSDPIHQNIYINDICISTHKKVDIYHFVQKAQETYAFDYINQIVKNSIKQKIKTLSFGIYLGGYMQILTYLDNYNYIEYYIAPLHV